MNFNINDLYIMGQPDYFEIYSGDTIIGYCDMDDEYALPFYLSDEKVYYGKNGDEHRSIGYDIIGVSPEYIFSLDDGREIERLEKMRDDAANKVRNGKNALPGRIWTHVRISKSVKLPFDISIISFWSYNSNINEKADRNLIRQIINDVGVDENNLFIAKFDDDNYGQGVLVKYANWDLYIPKMSDAQKNAYAIHLMNAKDKRNALTNFLRNRDRLIGKKLTNDKGVEMPVAQYRNMIYGENIKKQDRIIKEVINDYLKKNLL